MWTVVRPRVRAMWTVVRPRVRAMWTVVQTPPRRPRADAARDVVRDQRRGAGARGGDATWDRVRTIVDREGDRGADRDARTRLGGGGRAIAGTDGGLTSEDARDDAGAWGVPGDEGTAARG